MTDITRTNASIHGQFTSTSVSDLNAASGWGYCARLEFGDHETGKHSFVIFYEDPDHMVKRLKKLIKQIRKAAEATEKGDTTDD